MTNNLLEHKPYTYKENGSYVIYSVGKHHSRVDYCDVFFEEKFVFENKGTKQTEELLGLLNGAFLCGVSTAMADPRKELLKNYKPYSYKEVYHPSGLSWMGISGDYSYEIFFEEDKISTRGTKKQAEELIELLNKTYSIGVEREINDTRRIC